MQQDDSFTQNTNPASDDVAKQLADLQSQPATSQLPGQQFTPASTTSVPDEDTTEHQPEPVIESAPVDNQPQGFTPPADDNESEEQLSEDPPAEDTGPYQANPADGGEASSDDDQTETEQPAEAPAPDEAPETAPEPPVEAPAEKTSQDSPAESAPAVDFDFSALTGPSRSPTSSSDDSSSASDDDTPTDSDLEEVKKQTIEELAPLVDKLDLPPEKRYDILMEIIQANNDRAKLQDALRSASEITDLDLRARALMEILDEVKYFESSSNKS